MPPKPPPRTFPVIEIARKDVEPPKPLTPVIETLKPASLESAGRNFEFPDVPRTASNSPTVRSAKADPVLDLKHFEPKIASTPTLKHENMDFGESEISSLKTENSSKAVAENKVSPTNSVVRAMIHTSKGKSGNKKKNTLIASELFFLFFFI